MQDNSSRQEFFQIKITKTFTGAYLGFYRSVAYIQPLILPSPFINPSQKRSLAGTGKWVRAYTYAAHARIEADALQRDD